MARLPEATIRLWEPGKLMCDQLQTKIYKIGGAYYAVTGDGRTQSEPIFVLANNLKEAKQQGKAQLELILDAAKKAAPPPPPPMPELPDWVLDLSKSASPSKTQTSNTFDLEKLLNPTPNPTPQLILDCLAEKAANSPTTET
jgi:hypothetical protein